jgi:hypothetical protein
MTQCVICSAFLCVSKYPKYNSQKYKKRLQAKKEITNKLKLSNLSRQAVDHIVCKGFYCKYNLVTPVDLKRDGNTSDKIGNVRIT